MSALSLTDTVIQNNSPEFLSRVENDKDDIDLMINNGYKALDQYNIEEISSITVKAKSLLMGLKSYTQYDRSCLTESEITSLKFDSFYLSRTKQIRDLSRKAKDLMNKVSAENNHLWINNDGGRQGILGIGCDEAGDCVTRAVAIGTNECYGRIWLAFDDLLPENEDPDGGVSLTMVNTVLFRRKWTSHPVKKLTVSDFAKDGKVAILDCRFIDEVHLVAVKDGKLYDTWNSTGWLVTTAYYPETEKRNQGELIVTLD